MVFHSLQYLIFLPLVFLLFYWMKAAYRWAVLLLASLVFYAALGIPYLLLVLAWVILLTFFLGLRLKSAGSEKAQKVFLTVGVLGNLAPLLGLRYLPALLGGAAQGGPAADPLSVTLATFGVSFYSFQAISYLMDIYLERIDPEQHLGYFALFLSFFPKLIQGPIERGAALLPQLRRPFQFDYQNARDGLVQIAWGAFKKLVLADRLAVYVDSVYNQVHNFTGLPLVLATVLYAFQLYFDFSAYTDIALGSAKLFNIQLTQNFNSPYLAASVAEFWRRWHISFSRWILDYIFMPLQMGWRRWKVWGTAAALLVTFIASGFWHGARWGFAVWGLLHGLYLVFEVLTAPAEKKLLSRLKLTHSRWLKLWKIFITFSLVCFSWIFFRANTLEDALYVVTHLFTGLDDSLRLLFQEFPSWSGVVAFFNPLINELENHIGTTTQILLVFMILLTILSKKVGGRQSLWRQPLLVRWGLYYLLIGAVLFLGVFGQSQFIYFQF